MPPSGKDVVRELEKRGFVFRKGKGDHVVGRHADGRVTTVPMHKEIKTGTLKSIERQVGEKLDKS
ncbi:MAG: type II toxin-antitoxin system HicA family toxin [Hyphomonadaceae bacterium]